MVRFFIGLVTGIGLVLLTVLILFLSALRFREGPPEIANNSVLVVHLQGDLPEKSPVEIPFLSQGPALTVTNVWMMLREAAADSHIKAVVFEPEGLSVGWGKLEELRHDLENFRKSGKPVYAYLHTPSAREYYVATAADRIYLGPEDPLYLKGMRAEVMYYKKLLDKLGVAVQIEHAGKYKDFGDQFTRADMSPETREVLDSVVNGLYSGLVDGIAKGRNKTPDQVRALIDQGPFLAPDAVKDGLIDKLAFEDQMWGDLEAKLQSGSIKRVAADTYVRVPPESVGLQGKSRIAMIIAEGDIVRGRSDLPGIPAIPEVGDDNLASTSFDKVLEQVRNDSSIRGVIVRINSPGGEVTASDEIWRQMNLLSQKKPMIISMSDLAASGGYYMAMTGDPIVAYPGTETGSIGVVFGKPDLRGLYEKIGITKDGVQRGTFADIDSDYTSLSAAAQEKLRHGIDLSYQDFIAKVAQARHRTPAQIEPVAQGRVWLGSQGKDAGLVDSLGGIDTAVEMIKKKADIPASENVAIVTYPRPKSLLEMLRGRTQDDTIDVKLRQLFGTLPYHALLHGGFLRLSPYTITVQ